MSERIVFENNGRGRGDEAADLQKGRKALGAAFSHARKVAKKNGGGRKKEHEIANRYLRSNGHQSIGKSMTSPTFAQYAQALAVQAQSPGQPDDHWGMQQYQKLFQLNRDNVAALRQQAMLLQMRQGQ